MASVPNPPKQGSQPVFTDVLQSIHFESQQEVEKKETGLKLAKRIYSNQTSNNTDLNFFTARSAKWSMLSKWAMGKQSTKEFLDYFSVSDGNKAYVSIDMSPIMVGAQFVGTLVESMAKNEEYPQVSAIDDGSVSEKEERRLDALFRMHASKEIDHMQNAAGMMLEPANAYVPENELAAEVYFKLEDRLPKEIKMEQKLEAALLRNQYQRLLKPKLYFDYTVNNFGATKIESDGYGGYCIRKCIPQNVIYNYFQSDTGRHELSYIGEIYSLKVRDIRRKYGLSPSNPKGLTEEQIFNLAKKATQINVGTQFTYTWKPEFQLYNYNCPWDDYSVPVFDFEYQVSVSDYSVTRIDSYGKENISPKKSKPTNTSEKSKVEKKDKTRWYRGVYAPFADEMLYWGLPEVVLFPFMNTSMGLSSYSVNIPFNQGEYVPSLFERAMEPLREYSITKMKRKQLIASLRPAGIRIDVESARNISLGNGDTIAWEEVLRIYNQTGTEIWSSRGLNPNEREAPAIGSTAADDTIQKIIQLTSVLESCINEIRALLGVPTYRDGSDVGDRTAARLAEMQNTSSFNVTDFIPNALNQLMEETLYKCCIYEWQLAVKKNGPDADELISTSFEVSVQMKPTEYQKQLLAQRIEKWSATPDKNGDPLITPKDAFYIEQIKDYKLAQQYLANVVETNRKRHMEESEQLQKRNNEGQMASAQAAAQLKMQADQQKLQMEMQLKEFETTKTKEIELLKGFMQVVAKDESGQLLGIIMPSIQQLMPNIKLPLISENLVLQKQLMQKEQAAAQEVQQQQQIAQEASQRGMTPEQLMQQMSQQQQQDQPQPAQNQPA